LFADGFAEDAAPAEDDVEALAGRFDHALVVDMEQEVVSGTHLQIVEAEGQVDLER
jgi:hypothetical protein